MEFAEIQAEIKKQSEEMGALIQKRDDEIKSLGEADTKSAERIDELGKSIETMATESKGIIDAATARVDELEKKMNRPGFNGPDPDLFKSAGQRFSESEVYKDMISKGASVCDRVFLGSFFGRKDAPIGSITLDAASAGALVDPFRVPGVVIPPQRAFRVRDLLTVAPVSTGAIEYTEETGFAPFYTELSEDEAAAQEILSVVNTTGFFVGQEIYVGTFKAYVKSIQEDDGTITLKDGYGLPEDADKGTQITGSTFAPTSETNLKPQSNLQYALRTLTTKTIATSIPASSQALKDASQLQSMIDTRLLYALQLTEDMQLLYGNGKDPNIQGITTNANVQSYLWSSGVIGDTRIDAVRRAMTLARLAEYPIDGVVVHPTDWEYIELAKGTDERYIWVQVTTGGVQMLWKAPVVDTTAINAGDFLTGAFSLGATLYEEDQAAVSIAEQHKDYYARNMVLIRAEERVGLANFRPEAFVYGKFDIAPS